MADRRRNLGIPSGVVFPFAGNSAPYGYLICDGRAVSRTEYAALFLMIGTSHGQGDGSTTFNLPDYRGNFLRGKVDISTVTGSGTAASNQATFTNHGINRTGFRVRLSSGTLSGLSVSTDYFAIVVDDNTLAFATSQANALANTRVAITGVNSAVIAQWEDPDASSRIASTVGGNSLFQDGRSNNLAGLEYVAFQANSTPVTVPENGDWSSFLTLAASGNDANRPFRARNRGGESRPKNMSVNYIIKI